jgi:hypothetical protein
MTGPGRAAPGRAPTPRAVAEAARVAQENGRARRPSRDGLTIEQAAAV